MNRYWAYRKNKDAIRRFVLPNYKIKSGIWMPADECCDIKMAESEGLLSKATSLILVESNYKIYCKMKQNAPNIPAIKCVHSKIEILDKIPKIDYAYLDFMGGINNSISKWMSNVLSHNIFEMATIAITQMYCPRNNKIVLAQKPLLNKKEGEFINRYYGYQPENIRLILILLHRIFYMWDFSIEGEEIPKYKDSVNSMLCFKLVNFRKEKSSVFQPL